MLLAAGLSRGVDPLLQARNPSDFALDFGVEQQAPAHKPFGWDAYWGAADPHAGPSHSFARQRSALLEQQAAAATAAPKPTPAAGAAAPPKEPCEDKAYPPLGGPISMERCKPLDHCCSRNVPTAYGRRWTDECLEGVNTVEYCPLGTPFGNVGWRPDEGWCGRDHASGDVCTSCTCCCPNAPPDACTRHYAPNPTPLPTPLPSPAPCFFTDPPSC
jgi:hypothetical protein